MSCRAGCDFSIVFVLVHGDAWSQRVYDALLAARLVHRSVRVTLRLPSDDMETVSTWIARKHTAVLALGDATRDPLLADQKHVIHVLGADAPSGAQVCHVDEQQPLEAVRALRDAMVRVLRPVLLLDLDGVLVNFFWAFQRDWHAAHPGTNIDTSHYDLWRAVARNFTASDADAVPDAVRDDCKQRIDRILCRKRFFRDMLPMPGAVQAHARLCAAGYRVYLCTSPWPSNACCIEEKIQWCAEHLGRSDHVITTLSKFLIHGALLVDDFPRVGGALQPCWTQVVFDAPYNRQEADAIRLARWADCDATLHEALFWQRPLRASSAHHT